MDIGGTVEYAAANTIVEKPGKEKGESKPAKLLRVFDIPANGLYHVRDRLSGEFNIVRVTDARWRHLQWPSGAAWNHHRLYPGTDE